MPKSKDQLTNFACPCGVLSSLYRHDNGVTFNFEIDHNKLYTFHFFFSYPQYLIILR